MYTSEDSKYTQGFYYVLKKLGESAEIDGVGADIFHFICMVVRVDKLLRKVANLFQVGG
mgnify:CR=1 FL=1